MPQGPLLDLPLQSWAWEESATPLGGTDWDMATAGVANWVAGNAALLTKQVGPSVGQSALRVERTTTNDPYAYHAGSLFTVGAPYRVITKARGDGAKAFSFNNATGALLASGTASNAWQDFNFVYTQAGSGIGFYTSVINAVAPGFYMELGPTVVLPSYARTENVGLLGGSAELGNGLVTSSFPTQIGGMQRGMVLASGSSQVLQWYKALTSGTYTVAMTLMNLNSAAANGYLFDARESGGVGYALFTPGNLMGLSSGQPYLNGAPITTGVSAVPYGSLATLVCSGVTLSSTTKIVFGASSGIAFPWNGRFYNISIYPGTLTATQARAYHERQMSLISMR